MLLADLIDLEAQIARDEGQDSEGLRARDRAIGLELGAERLDSGPLLSGWLAALRARSPNPPAVGAVFLRAGRWLALLLGVLGALAGFGAARATLASDGTTPVNVMSYLWLFVGAQLIVLLFVGTSALVPSSALERWPLAGELRALLGAATRAIAARLAPARRHLDDDRVEAWALALHRLRARSALYRPVERWWLMSLAQWFGLAFNLAALLGCAQLIAFSDLAFAWSTTLDLDAKSFHRLVALIGAPWATFAPEAVPSEALVELSRYSRLHGAYLGPGGDARDPILVGQWWRFLVAATIGYGLLPRLLLAVVARLGLRRSLARLRFDSPDVARVLRRLRSPQVETQSRRPQPVPKPVYLDETSPAPSGPRPPAGKARSLVILWRDVPDDRALLGRIVEEQLHLALGAVERAGGAEYLAASQGLGADGGPIVVIAEAWEAPDKATLRFLRELRRRVGPERSVVLGLVDSARGAWAQPTSLDLGVWRERTATLEDPYLGLEPLGRAG